MNENDARQLARAYADEHRPELSERPWRVTRFANGWTLVPEYDDVRSRLGAIFLLVTDDGVVHQDSSSLPPDMLYAKYASSSTQPPPS